MIDFKQLKPGSLVRHKSGGTAIIVTANYGDRVTAVLTVDLTNPSEWDEVDEAGEVKFQYYRPKVTVHPNEDPMPKILVGESLAHMPPGTYDMVVKEREDGMLVAELATGSELPVVQGKLERETVKP